jgi:ribosomal protein S18 acetylase RimI-like enzyme
MIIRTMTLKDYDKVYELWSGIKGFALRSLDDSREGVEKFLKRNPDTSVVAEENGRIIGTILSGHDGRSASFYHVCVARDYRGKGVGHQMVSEALLKLKEEQISKVSLIAFCSNEIGNKFWQDLGFTLREDINSYDCVLNEENKYNINS